MSPELFVIHLRHRTTILGFGQLSGNHFNALVLQIVSEMHKLHNRPVNKGGQSSTILTQIDIKNPE